MRDSLTSLTKKEKRRKKILLKKWANCAFPLFWWVTLSKSLRSLRGNERLWANRSGCSRQMSNHERFAQVAQVAQRKWAIMSESLRSLTKNERMNESLIFFSELLICSFLDKKRAIRSEIKRANSQPCEMGAKYYLSFRWKWWLIWCAPFPVVSNCLQEVQLCSFSCCAQVWKLEHFKCSRCPPLIAWTL